MRSQTLAESSKRRRRQFAAFTSTSTSAAWHARALREASTVRRLLRGARAGGAGVIGEKLTIDALQHGTVRELLLTRRFVELHPGAFVRATQCAAAHGVRTTTITGLAAFELDLAATGIAALLRRAPRAAMSIAWREKVRLDRRISG
jgi:hypothetical protein